MKYAAIIKGSVTIPGDERSRTNPGHGYPEYEQETIDFKEFESQEACKQWIRMQSEGYSYNRNNYRIIEYQDVQIQTELVVNFKKPVATRQT